MEQEQEILNESGDLEQYVNSMVSSSRQETHETKFGTSRHLDELLHESRSKNAARKRINEDDILSEATSLLNELLMDSPAQTKTVKNEEHNDRLPIEIPQTANREDDSVIDITNNIKELEDAIDDLPSQTIENKESTLSEMTSETSSSPLNETGYNSLSQSDTEEELEDDDTSSEASVDLDTLLNEISSPQEELSTTVAETLRSDSPRLAPSPCPTEDRVMVRF